MTKERIAIVGIGLRYPDATSPAELWENVLAGRRAFRRLPDERMNHQDYFSPDPAAPDRFYARQAAVLRDYEFDRVGFRVAGSTFRSTDMTHWLALDVASRALADAGFVDGDGLPKATTGVVVGNSLTGEFTRANIMRLRWPYVRRTVAAALTERGWSQDETTAFLRDLEAQYKAPFPDIDEDTLAGGLANTIAGRICNYFDLAGGGFTVDGACSSSLLSVATAATALADGDLDVAIAGGVDLSIDPFEVIGFSKTGALATSEMKVYDKNSNGFWPGEGSGMLVLMREQDAVRRGARIYACIAGWGVSSDGKGGMTRPEAAGHRLALRRAYGRAGYGVDTVSYFEGHGTGTALGDATEIDALSSSRRDADPFAAPAALSTVKGNIGHTKAAAGVAGLIKAALAVFHQVIPPGTGQHDPHPALLGDSATMYVPTGAVPWPRDSEIRAGVSAMGFGGINSHVTLTAAPGAVRRQEIDDRTVALVSGRQDAEVLLLDAGNAGQLRDRVRNLLAVVAKLSFAELADLAGTLAGELSGKPVRAAVVVTSPEDAEHRLTRLLDSLTDDEAGVFAAAEGVFAAERTATARIGFLFPGQGTGQAPVGALRRRFAEATDELFRHVRLSSDGDQVATEVAQPRIVLSSLVALRVLRHLGIDAGVAAGHSLGELTALHWGGAMDEQQVLRLATIRGQVMATASHGDGAMAGLAASPSRAEALAEGEDVVIAGYNAPEQTVISGPASAVDRVCERARNQGVTATRLSVSHAFHSPAVEPAAAAMTERLAEFGFARLDRPVVSTVTGDVLHAAENLGELLREQIVLPVRFREAAALVAERSDLVIELGPGRVLSGLFREIAPGVPVLPIDTGSPSVAPLLRVVAAAFVLGAPVDTTALFAGRVVRPLPLDGAMSFLASPCEAAPAIGFQAGPAEQHAPATQTPVVEVGQGGNATLDLLRKLAAERVELPLDAVTADTHPLDDLHLSSITVGQLVNDVTRALGRPALEGTPNFATVALGELAEMIDELAETAHDDAGLGGEIPGVASWVRPFAVEYVEASRPVTDTATGVGAGEWSVYAPDGHPLAKPLRAALAGAGVGDGVLLCLPPDCDETHVGLFLTAGRAAIAAPNGTRFVVVQHGLGASGLARTLHLEDPSARTTIVDLADVMPSDPAAVTDAMSTVVAEVMATTSFSEARYDSAGRRFVPLLKSLTADADAVHAIPLGPDDVLLVTGGGKGVTAESAIALAKDSAAKLAVLGRSDPAADPELAGTLARMDAARIRYRYVRADVTSASQVADAVAAIQAEFGPVTAILHGAGRNEPAALMSLTEEAFHRTLAPKIGGLRAILDAVDPGSVKLLVTFGSIIGRAGLRGEAHYATANDWMTELTRRFGRQHPHARAIALEWSVWSGTGMGEKLGVVSALLRDGITPIPIDWGISVLRQVVSDPDAPGALVVCGRTGGLPTLPVERRELPLTRFVDRAVVHYPGIELVTEADLSAGSDPYLSDHLLEGDLLFPAVLGMEAMTQVATAVLGRAGVPMLEDVRFLRPIVVPVAGATTIRLAALVRDSRTVDVVVRSEETGFSADHFRATLRFPRPEPPASPDRTGGLPLVPVDPVAELYGTVLFQGKRFQRVTGYRRASARHAVAEIATGADVTWFAPFLPQDRLLADPGTRDATMHGIQCCVPDATLLPQGIDRLYLADPSDQDGDYVLLDARERSQDGDTYVYDIDVRDSAGRVVERWEGLSLRAVRKRGGAGPWVPAMLGSYVERSVERVLGGRRAVVVEPDPSNARVATVAERRRQTELALSRAVGKQTRLRYRSDGKPETDDVEVSASHSAGLTFVIAGTAPLGCDVQSAIERTPADWAGLLGADLLAVGRLLARETGEPATLANTRVWSALECVRKTGAMTQALTVLRTEPDGWALLSSGEARIATWATTVAGRPDPVVFAVLQGRES